VQREVRLSLKPALILALILRPDRLKTNTRNITT
jgi:hypothetical protein